MVLEQPQVPSGLHQLVVAALHDPQVQARPNFSDQADCHGVQDLRSPELAAQLIAQLLEEGSGKVVPRPVGWPALNEHVRVDEEVPSKRFELVHPGPHLREVVRKDAECDHSAIVVGVDELHDRQVVGALMFKLHRSVVPEVVT